MSNIVEPNQKRVRQYIFGYIKNFLKDRFSLEDDKAHRDEVVESVYKGVEFRGVNLWVLIFATMIASLGLNLNSIAVIIGAMLISPIMGPIMGMGLSLGINDFELFKKSLRNYTLMFSVAIVTSTIYFLCSPLDEAQTELIARTTPTAYDVLIAFVGGMAGMVAQTRKDKSSTVIPGVAIATALIPPLCTVGFGIATGQFTYIAGAFYLFFINTVFIALATYTIVRFLKYDKKVFIDKVRERNVRRIMMFITLVTFIPSVIIGLKMVKVTLFEAAANKYVDQVFNYKYTRVIEANLSYEKGDRPSRIELLLVGELLEKNEIDNVRSQLSNFGLKDAELVVRQANTTDKVDVNTMQSNYAELIREKNRHIDNIETQLEHYKVTDLGVDNLSKEIGILFDDIERVTITKGLQYSSNGDVVDTILVCVVKAQSEEVVVDEQKLIDWLSERAGISNIKLMIE